jgi:arylsulfatase A-like enzyme
VRGSFGKMGGVGPQNRVPLAPDDVTVAEVLRQAGYTTGMTGKWGLGEPGSSGVPTRQGFDAWFGYLNQRNAHSYYPPYLWNREEQVILHGNQDGKKEEYTHDLFTEFALDFIQENQHKPFFLYIPYTIPHAKYEIPSTEPYHDKPWKTDEKVHAAMITRMDRDVGRIMGLLKRLDLDHNTMVFFCSDNGAAQRWEGRFDSSGLLRGRKRDLYEGGIRVPMIVRYPGQVPAGRSSHAAWYFADVLPTLASIAGAVVPNGIDGMDIAPALLGKELDTNDRFLYWEFHENKKLQQAVRWRDWKAVRLDPNEPLELYNLADDERESVDVALQNPSIVRRVEAYLKTARTPSVHWPVPGD